MAVELNQRYEHRKSHKVAYVARIDEVGKAVDLMYENVTEDDKQKGVRVSLTSLPKSWKKLIGDTEVSEPAETKTEEVEVPTTKDAEPVETEDTENVVADETPAEEGTVAAAIAKANKKASKKKEKAEKPVSGEDEEKPVKAKAPKKEKKVVVDDADRVITSEYFLDYIKGLGGTVVKGGHEYFAKAGKRTFALYSIAKRNTKVTLKIKPNICKVKPDEVSRYQFSNRHYFKAEDAKAKATIEELLKCAYEDAIKNDKKDKKDEKEEN